VEATAATDFSRMAGPPSPVRVREVRSGYIMSADQGRQYRLCGTFSRARAGEKVEWMPFATIRTSGCEQYVGAQASSECTRSSIVWEQGDLSTVLQSRLEGTR